MRPVSYSSAAIVSAAIGIALVVTLILLPHPARSSSTPTAISGWAWSDTIGWISLNCATGGPTGGTICGSSNYGLTIAADGTVSGYAWSDNIGWVSANAADIASCASGATSKIANGTWTGWLRAIAGGAAQSGGWDGCISMNGSNSNSTWSVTYDQTTGIFAACSAGSSCAWGGDVVGWVDLSKATVAVALSCQTFTGPRRCGVPPGENANDIYQNDTAGNQCKISSCTGQLQCVNGSCFTPVAAGSITAKPSVVVKGGSTSLSWNGNNLKASTSCSIAADGNSDSWSSTVDSSGNMAGGPQPSSAIQKQTIYTLRCTAIDGSPFTTSVTVTLIPAFREI